MYDVAGAVFVGTDSPHGYNPELYGYAGNEVLDYTSLTFYRSRKRTFYCKSHREIDEQKFIDVLSPSVATNDSFTLMRIIERYTDRTYDIVDVCWLAREAGLDATINCDRIDEIALYLDIEIPPYAFYDELCYEIYASLMKLIKGNDHPKMSDRVSHKPFLYIPTGNLKIKKETYDRILMIRDDVLVHCNAMVKESTKDKIIDINDDATLLAYMNWKRMEVVVEAMQTLSVLWDTTADEYLLKRNEYAGSTMPKDKIADLLKGLAIDPEIISSCRTRIEIVQSIIQHFSALSTSSGVAQMKSWDNALFFKRHRVFLEKNDAEDMLFFIVRLKMFLTCSLFSEAASLQDGMFPENVTERSIRRVLIPHQSHKLSRRQKRAVCIPTIDDAKQCVAAMKKQDALPECYKLFSLRVPSFSPPDGYSFIVININHTKTSFLPIDRSTVDRDLMTTLQTGSVCERENFRISRNVFMRNSSLAIQWRFRLHSKRMGYSRKMIFSSLKIEGDKISYATNPESPRKILDSTVVEYCLQQKRNDRRCALLTAFLNNNGIEIVIMENARVVALCKDKDCAALVERLVRNPYRKMNDDVFITKNC